MMIFGPEAVKGLASAGSEARRSSYTGQRLRVRRREIVSGPCSGPRDSRCSTRRDSTFREVLDPDMLDGERLGAGDRASEE